MSEQPEALTDAPRSPGLPVWERAIRIFVRPAQAWEGLEHKVQFWIPLVFILILNGAFAAATYHRVLVPMMLDQWDEAVANAETIPQLKPLPVRSGK